MNSITLVEVLVVLYLMSFGIVMVRTVQVEFQNWRAGRLHWSWLQWLLALAAVLVPLLNTWFAVSALRHYLEDT